jgi:predicted nucleic acid-binding protein
MKKIFFDTWGWVAIAHKEDNRHAEVVPFYKAYLLKKGIPITTDYVLAETVTLLRAKTHGVGVFIDAILSAAKDGKIIIERIGEARWEKAWTLGKKYQDKPDISFVDFTSFVIMKEAGISEALTADRHYEEVGLGLKKLF